VSVSDQEPAPRLTAQRAENNPLRVQLAWSEVLGADKYVLERASAWGWAPPGDREFQEVYRGSGRVYIDAPAQSTTETSWRYRVRADASGDAGRWSEPVEISTGF
jgi:hypothetical protein